MNAVIYARFSPRPNASQCESCETQVEYCKRYIEQQGWTLLEVFQDRDVSGKSMKRRPGVVAAIALAKKERAALVVYSLSRLSRSVKDCCEIAERLQAGRNKAQLVSLHEHLDTSTAMGRFAFGIFALMAQMERELTGERTSEAMQRYSREGRRMWRHAPYGWKQPEGGGPLVADEHEQQVMSMIENAGKQGMTPSHIVLMLDEQGVRCRGRRWYRSTVVEILDRADAKNT